MCRQQLETFLSIIRTEAAEGRRETTLHGVLSTLAGGERSGGAMICTVMGALIKKKINFPHILGKPVGSGAKSYMTNDLLIYGENICAFPHILGSPSSYMTLHPIPSEFPYI
jgi:hypothetical protein